MNVTAKFWSASLEDMKKGFGEEADYYVCLLCGKKVEKGLIYQVEESFYEAGKYMGLHIQKAHGSVFHHLIRLDKKFTGLTDHQSKLLELFYQGKDTAEIQQALDIGSPSTIRNHRFVLKEKERQAKVFLTLMELLKAGDTDSLRFIPPHETARMVDDRYNITEEENAKILQKYFVHGLNGPLKTFAMKEKSKLVVLRQISKSFAADRLYSEKEIDGILANIYEDYVTLRRYLIDYGFMDRTPDGSRYWLRENQKETGDYKMDRKKELIRQYKETKPEAGVYQIRNTKNRKVFVTGTPNLKTINGKLMTLRGGGHYNKELQKEWQEFGEEAFVFEILEVLEEPEEGFFDRKEELKKLEEKWLEKLQPFGERGYHKKISK
ncbi:MAG: DUF2087 domain-containing protein [Peptococcaceae bacterium]